MKKLLLILIILSTLNSIAQETCINKTRKQLIETLRYRGNEYVSKVDNNGDELFMEAYNNGTIYIVAYYLKNNIVILQENTYNITLLSTMLKEMNTHLNYIKESIWHNKEQTLGFKIVVKRDEEIFELTIIKL